MIVTTVIFHGGQGVGSFSHSKVHGAARHLELHLTSHSGCSATPLQKGLK